MQVSKVLPTSGDGYWSNVQANVPLVGLDLAYVNDEADFGELRVYFDHKSWNVNRDGLIYTDRLFLHELKHFLVGELGLAGDDVGYSEQGMQGDDFVSLDVGDKFIASWKKVAV